MSVHRFFNPRGVAVVGSMSEGKLGYELLRQMILGGYRGSLYAVNPKAQGALDIPAFAAVDEIEGELDLVVIASPAPTVVETLHACGRRGVQAAVVISSGFGEVGNHAGEEALKQAARQYGIRVIGPNCAGIVSTSCNLYATLEVRPPAGKMAFISQSGALGGAVLAWAEEQGVGISRFVSYGNRADLDELELLPYLAEDPETRVAALYIESVADGRRFIEVVREFCRRKPLVVIKSGCTASGQRAALSHTGSLAGADAVYDAALKSSGAIRVETVEDMFDLCKGFVFLPPVTGKKVVIVTNSGGPGILAADRAEMMGLEVKAPSAEARRRLADALPPFCALGNPVDLTVQGTEDHFRQALETLLEEYDAALAINVATPYLDSVALARGVCDAAQHSRKAVTASFMAGRLVASSVAYLRQRGIPDFAVGERAVTVLAHMAAYEARRAALPSVPETPQPAGALPLNEQGEFLEPQAMSWLSAHGVPVPPFRFAGDETAAVEGCRAVGYPAVMKVVSPQIIHKSEVGGVIVGISSDEEAVEAFRRLESIGREKQLRGVVIYPQLPKAQEVLLGCSRDPQFGPVVVLGMGGIYTEILKDISLRVAPLTREEAQAMIGELKAYPILSGARGQTPCDLDTLADTIVHFSRLPFLYPEIQEIDLNPVFLFNKGLLVADVRVIRGGN